MAKTYEPIASQTLGSNAASVTFDNIAATWTDLVLVWNGKNTGVANTQSMNIRFNGDTANNYSMTRLYGNGSSALSARTSSVSDIYVGENHGTLVSGPNPIIVQVMSYANSSVRKTALIGYASSDFVGRHVGLWRSTSAITSITCRTYGGGTELTSGSVLSLYGIKAA